MSSVHCKNKPCPVLMARNELVDGFGGDIKWPFVGFLNANGTNVVFDGLNMNLKPKD